MNWPNQIFSFLSHGKYLAEPLAIASGAVRELLIDALGRLQVRVVAGPIITHWHRAITPAASAVVGSGARKVVAVWGFNKGEDPVYVGLYNRTSVPTEGTEQPTEQFLVPAGGSFSFQPPEPIAFAAGIVWAASSTPGVWTSPGASDVCLTLAHQAGA